MHVLAIGGSPVSGGNTSNLLNACLAGAREAGARTTLVELRALNYGGCVACDGCKGKGARCLQKDDLARVLDQVAEADAVILGSPLYGWCVSSQLKACMDRFYGFLDARGQSRLPGKKPAALVVCHANGDETAYRPSLEAATRAMGLLFAEPELLIGAGLGAHDEATRRPDLRERAKALGRRLAGGRGVAQK